MHACVGERESNGEESSSVNFWPTYFGFHHSLNCVAELARTTMKKLNQGITDQNKALAAATSGEAKASIVS